MNLKKPTVEAMMSVVEDEGAKTDWYEEHYGPLGFLKLSIEEVEAAVDIKLFYEADTCPVYYKPSKFASRLGVFFADLKERLSPDFDVKDIGGAYPLFMGLRVVTKSVTLDIGGGAKMTLSHSSNSNVIRVPDDEYTCIVCGTPISKNNPSGWCLECDATMDDRHERLLAVNKKLSEQLEASREETAKYKMGVEQWESAQRETADKLNKARGTIRSLKAEIGSLCKERDTVEAAYQDYQKLKSDYEVLERDRKELLKKESALIAMNNVLNQTRDELKESEAKVKALEGHIKGLVEACGHNEEMYDKQRAKISDLSLQLIRLIAPATHVKHEIKAILKQVEDL